MKVWEAVGIGTLVAMRSMTLPAVLSDYLAQQTTIAGDNNPITQFMTRGEVALLTKAMAAGEIVFDKMPFTPNRTDAMPLLGRVFIAATLAASLSKEQDRVVSAAIAGASAWAASHLLYTIRNRAVHTLRLPALNTALSEDALALAGSILWRDVFTQKRT
jgi:uncharacterized membrane protein